MMLPNKIITTQYGKATDLHNSPHYGSSELLYIGWHHESEEEQYSIWIYTDDSLYYCKSK